MNWYNSEEHLIKFDSHTHTLYSHDADKNVSVRSMCVSAIDKGITHLAITDHYDINEVEENIIPRPDLDARRADIEAAAEEFKGKLHISHGIELGQAIQYPEQTNELLDKYRFDTVIASVHYMRGHDDFYHWNMSEYSLSELEQAWAKYLVDLEETVDFGRADVLAHFNYPLRYATIAGKIVDISFSYDVIERICKKVISKDMLFEVNSSGFRQGVGAPLPDERIISIYRDCGGKLISVGSDAHTPKDVAADFDITEKYIKKCGFDRIYFRHNGQTEDQKI